MEIRENNPFFQDPRIVIANVKTEIAPLGGNDTEFSQLDIILKKWEDKEISWEDANKQAFAIQATKLQNDYH